MSKHTVELPTEEVLQAIGEWLSARGRIPFSWNNMWLQYPKDPKKKTGVRVIIEQTK